MIPLGLQGHNSQEALRLKLTLIRSTTAQRPKKPTSFFCLTLARDIVSNNAKKRTILMHFMANLRVKTILRFICYKNSSNYSKKLSFMSCITTKTQSKNSSEYNKNNAVQKYSSVSQIYRLPSTAIFALSLTCKTKKILYLQAKKVD